MKNVTSDVANPATFLNKSAEIHKILTSDSSAAVKTASLQKDVGLDAYASKAILKAAEQQKFLQKEISAREIPGAIFLLVRESNSTLAQVFGDLAQPITHFRDKVLEMKDFELDLPAAIPTDTDYGELAMNSPELAMTRMGNSIVDLCNIASEN